MRVQIDFTKTMHENASAYYDAAKKAKKKLTGLARGVSEVELKLAASKEPVLKRSTVKKRERKWFEKYHWFYTSEGFLVIGGRDAKGNEQIVTKLMEPHDVYFHADIHGAPHVILKTEGKNPGEESLKQSAIFAAVFSKAWQEQFPALDVYSAKPEQVSKKAPTGEAIGAGAFMIYGQRTWYKKTPLVFTAGISKGSLELFSCPPSAAENKSAVAVQIEFGTESKGDAAKKILGYFSNRLGKNLKDRLDEMIALLPNGGIGVDFE